MRTETIDRIHRRQTLPPPQMRRAIRLEAGITAEEFGQEFEPPVSPSAVCRWETGEREPTGVRRDQLASLLAELEALIWLGSRAA